MACKIEYNGQLFDNTEQLISYLKEKEISNNFKQFNYPVKEGVSDLFKSNTELASIGTQQQYSKYLDTIFPDSKVKDIVYHGTDKTFEQFSKDAEKATIADQGIFFAPTKNQARNSGKIIVKAVINSNPLISDNRIERISEKKRQELISQGYNGYVYSYNKTISSADDIAVFEPEQIHILGSKQDIEGFKNFVSSNSFKASKPLNSGFVRQSDLADFVTEQKSGMAISEENEDFIVDQIYSNILSLKPSERYYKERGFDFDFTKSSDLEIKMKIKKELVPNLISRENSLSAINQWIADGMDLSTINSYFKNGKVPLNPETIDTLTGYLNISRTDKVQSVKDYLGDKYIPFFPKNTMIITHGDGSVSIFELTSEKLGAHDTGGKELFHKVASDRKASLYNLTYNNNLGGVKHLTNGLLAAYLKNINPSISLKTIKIINPNVKDANIQTVEMSRAIQYFNFIKNTDTLSQNMPKEIMDMLNNDNVFKEHEYRQDFLSQLSEAFIEMMTSGDSLTYITGDKLRQYKKTGLNKEETIRALKDWMKQRQRGQSSINMSTDKNYILAAETLKQLTDSKVDRENTLTNIGDKVAEFRTMANVNNEVFQYIKEKVVQAGRKISDAILAFNEINQDQIKKVEADYKARNKMSYISERLTDKRPDMYAALYKTKTAKYTNKNGIVEDVQVKLREIHWDINDPETKKLVADGTISKTLLEYGKFYVEQQKEILLDHYSNELLKTNAGKYYKGGALNQELLKKDAEETYKANVPKEGVVPYFGKTAIQSLSADAEYFGVKEFIKKSWDNTVNPNKLFDEDFSEGNQNNMYDVADKFNHQFKGVDTNGPQTGLIYDHGILKIENKKKVDNFNTDLGTLLELMKRNTTRKIIYENEAMPFINSGLALLDVAGQTSGLGADGVAKIKEITQLFVDRVIHGKTNDDIGKMSAWKQSLVVPMAALKKISSNASVALSVPVAIKSALQNHFSTFTFAIANSVSGSEMFGLKEALQAEAIITKALGERLSNLSQKEIDDFKKLVKLGEMHGVLNVDEHDITDSPLYQKNKKLIWQSTHFHFMNFSTDYLARLQVMCAQMIKDGTFEGYSLNKDEELVYNEKFDKRIYKDGKLTEDGKLIREAKIQDLIEQGLQTETDKLTRGYDRLEERKLKAIADRFVLGSYSKMEVTTAESKLTTSILLQFKRYLPDKFFNKFGEGLYNRDLGQRKVITTAEGKQEVIWENKFVEGQLYSLSRALIDVSQTAKKHGLMTAMSKENWNKIPLDRRQNIARLITEVAAFGAMYIAYKLLQHGLDDEDEFIQEGERKGEYKDKSTQFLMGNRYSKAIYQSMFDVMQMLDVTFYRDVIVNPSPAISNFDKLSEIIFEQKIENLPKLAPGSTTVMGAMEIFENNEETNE